MATFMRLKLLCADLRGLINFKSLQLSKNIVSKYCDFCFRISSLNEADRMANNVAQFSSLSDTSLLVE